MEIAKNKIEVYMEFIRNEIALNNSKNIDIRDMNHNEIKGQLYTLKAFDLITEEQYNELFKKSLDRKYDM